MQGTEKGNSVKVGDKNMKTLNYLIQMETRRAQQRREDCSNWKSTQLREGSQLKNSSNPDSRSSNNKMESDEPKPIAPNLWN